jgi:putative aldouronate transport system permease protein
MKYIKKNWPVYALFLPVLIWIVMFVYIPFIMNIVISFQDYNIDLGIGNSNFIGLENYKVFFSGDNFVTLLKNTLFLNLLILGLGFPLAILLAILIFEAGSKWLKGLTQTATFLPYFISGVVVTGIVIEFLKIDTGLITRILEVFGMERQNYLANPDYFRLIYALKDLWQTLGYNTMIYFAALTMIDPTLYEAARLDGASKFQQIRTITIPSLAPIIITTLLLRLGRIMQHGYEQVLLLQNDGNRVVSEIISTYVYNVSLAPRVGLPNYGVAAVVGIFDAVVAIVLIFISNRIARKVSGTSLW